jgi:hypothetical protein
MTHWIDTKGRMAEAELTEEQEARLAEGLSVSGYGSEITVRRFSNEEARGWIERRLAEIERRQLDLLDGAD